VPENIAAKPLSVAMLCDIVVISDCTGEITAADAAADAASVDASDAFVVAVEADAVADVSLAAAAVALDAAAVALDAAAFWLAVADAASTINDHLALSVFVVSG